MHPDLEQSIDSLLSASKMHVLLKARKDLTEKYQGKAPPMTETECLAYLGARLPATYAVLSRIMQALPIQPRTLLDLGSGPGTALWAASACFPSLETITAYEQNPLLINIGEKLAKTAPFPALKNTTWQLHNLAANATLPKNDLVVLSYVIGELAPETIPSLIDSAWNAASELLLIVEPGTPKGFERIRAVREQLIKSSGFIVAPCTHQDACPMANGNWCHFATRLNRTSLQRKLKEGELSYEDEKYSYIAVSKHPTNLQNGRILRHPLKRTGHLILELCTPRGLKQITLSKKQGDLYKQAKELQWGDTIDIK